MSRRAGVYVRISSDPSGERLGVTRQLDACRAKATALGWSLAGVYEDNDVSASTSRARPSYQRLLGDLEDGKINAVVVWDLDRLTRRPIEIEAFIDLADRQHVALASVGGDVDLATDNGRMFARIKGAVARAEVERKSARQRAANDQRAEKGQPFVGRRAFGYSADSMRVVESEAREVRAAFEALLSGVSLRSMVNDLRDRGVKTTAGGAWHPSGLRRVLSNPRYAARRIHRGEDVGPGVWPAIVDLDSFRAAQGVLSDPARHMAGPPTRYLLSGVAVCAVCGGRIYGAREPRGRTYLCGTRKHVVRRADPVEALVVALVLARLQQPDARKIFARPEARSDAAVLRDEEQGLRSRLDGLAEAFAEGVVDRQALAAGSARLRKRLSDVEARLADLAVTPAVAELLAAADVESAWLRLDLDRQRAVVGTLLHISLESPGRGVRTFDPQTVQLTWR